MRYNFNGSTTFVSVGAGVATHLQSIVPGATLKAIESFQLETQSRDLSHRNMLWRILEYDTDGTSGSANNAVAEDSRVTVGVPTGRAGFTPQTGTNIPNGGTVREVDRGFIHPTNDRVVDLVSLVTGRPPLITPGRVASFIVTPVEAQNVRLLKLSVVDG